jgi:transketolase
LRKTFTSTTANIITENKNSALLLGDIGVYGFRDILSAYPERAFNIGILEQSMVSIAAGLASEGIIPIIHTIAPFIVERALEQIKVDFGYQKLPGNFVSVGASFDYAKLGCTHHCPGDVNILSNIPGVNIFIPGHSKEFENQLINNWNSGKVNYYRLSENQNSEAIDVKFGEIRKLKNGDKGVLIVVGPFLKEVLESLTDLDIEIHYCNSITGSLSMRVQSEFSGKKVIIYEPYYSGALLFKIIEQITANACEVMQMGVPREFIEKYGTYQEQLEYLKLDSNSIRNRVEKFISQ